MKKYRFTTVLLCGLMTMAVTIVFYLLAYGNILAFPIRSLSLFFLLMVEVFGTAKALKSEKSIFGTANIMVSVIHLGLP